MNTITPPSSKQEVQAALKTAFQDVVNYINTLSEKDFQEPYGDKWSAAEHLAHLIMSAFPVTSALKQPKIVFRAFGTSKNGSISYDMLYQKYKQRLADGIKADAKRTPGEKDLSDKSGMLTNWEMILHKFEERLDSWSEEDLDKYRVPHPALGKLTFREMLYFTVFHTLHHLQVLKDRGV